MENSTETTQEVYLYVNFDNKIKDDAFRNKFFLRMTNLDAETPLVQLNDDLFKGHYEDCVGTNLFFKDVDRPPEDCPFKEETTIHLEHTVAQFKELVLTPVCIPKKIKDIPEPEYDIEINTNYEYNELLKKLANGSLNLEDNLKIVPKGSIFNFNQPEIVKSCSEPQIQETLVEETKEIDEPEIIEEYEVKTKTVDILTWKYEKLKRLARRPNRRKIIPESVTECEAQYRKAYEYNCLKSQVMMPSDYFPTISKQFNKETLVGAVDIDRSVLQGFIRSSSDYYRILTEDEKTALLCMENMHNLSMLARFFVLKAQLEYLESLLLTEPEEKLNEKDEFNRTIQDNIDIYKKLIRVINGLIEGKYFYNSDCETDNEESTDELTMETKDASQETEESMDIETDS